MGQPEIDDHFDSQFAHLRLKVQSLRMALDGDKSNLDSLALSIRSVQTVTQQLIQGLDDQECYAYPSHRPGVNPAGSDVGMFGWTPFKCWSSLEHPFVYLYAMHFCCALLATFYAYRAPKHLLTALAVSGLLWPFSALIQAFLGGRSGWIWYTEPWTDEWIMIFIKWAIVNAAAGLPILYVRAYDCSEKLIHRIGIFIYSILGANILWTLIYKVNGYVQFFNSMVAMILAAALTIQSFALLKSGKPLLEKVNGVPYGRSTPFDWLVCYTIWNATFVADLSIGMTLQDLLFWFMMLLMQRIDEMPLLIGSYFAFARPIQLGTYIAVGCWSGLVPWLRDAEKNHPVERLGINDDFYFLFITLLNLGLSVKCLVSAVRALIAGYRALPENRPRTMVTVAN